MSSKLPALYDPPASRIPHYRNRREPMPIHENAGPDAACRVLWYLQMFAPVEGLSSRQIANGMKISLSRVHCVIAALVEIGEVVAC
jgi:hypothetical protein